MLRATGLCRPSRGGMAPPGAHLCRVREAKSSYEGFSTDRAVVVGRLQQRPRRRDCVRHSGQAFESSQEGSPASVGMLPVFGAQVRSSGFRLRGRFAAMLPSFSKDAAHPAYAAVVAGCHPPGRCRGGHSACAETKTLPAVVAGFIPHARPQGDALHGLIAPARSTMLPLFEKPSTAPVEAFNFEVGKSGGQTAETLRYGLRMLYHRVQGFSV